MNQRAESGLVPALQNLPKSNRVLCVPKGWDTYISGEFFEIHQALENKGWLKLIIDEASDADLLAAIREAEVVLLWEAYEFIERNASILSEEHSGNSKQQRVFFCDDVHHFTTGRRVQRLRAFTWASLILATYPDRLQQWFPEIDRLKVKWTPHSAASYFGIHKREPGESSNLVLLSGSRTWPYPFRQFCAAKLDSTVCAVIDHPGYPGYPGDRANNMVADSSALRRLGRERYAALLHGYPAMLVCGSILGYLVAKVFEGMAAGCLTICERASLGQQLAALGFREGQHYIGTDLPTLIEDVQRVRNAYMADPEHWHGITQAAAAKVFEEHTTAARAAQIHSICMESVEI